MKQVRISFDAATPMIKDVAFSLASLAVIAAAITMIFMPPRYSIAVSTSSRAIAAADLIEVYGSLKDTAGNPIPNAIFEVFDASGKRQDKGKTRADGTFVSHFNDSGGPFTVTITAVINGQTVRGSTTMDMQPGYSYGFVMTLGIDNSIIWVPIPGY